MKEEMNDFEREKKEIIELNVWLEQYRHEDYRKSSAFRSNELGGHVDLRESDDISPIGPTQEEIHDILKYYGKKLGIDYVVR